MTKLPLSKRFEVAIATTRDTVGIVRDMLPPGRMEDEAAAINVRMAKDHLTNALECLERAARIALQEGER